jgi:hypothetical protein
MVLLYTHIMAFPYTIHEPEINQIDLGRTNQMNTKVKARIVSSIYSEGHFFDV